MTAPTNGSGGKLYVIRKAGAYYRPNAQGYTTSEAEAGRFTLEEAIAHSHPNGPDGPRDEITYELARTPPAQVGAVTDSGEGVRSITAAELGEIMQEEWGEICEDAQAHPSDIRREGRKLFYDPRHWTDAIARRLNERLASPTKPVAHSVEAVALNGYRAAVSYISADSWDGCSDCIEILRAARSADHSWDWAGDTNRIAEELKAIRPFCNHEPASMRSTDQEGLVGALREIIEREIEKQTSASGLRAAMIATSILRDFGPLLTRARQMGSEGA